MKLITAIDNAINKLAHDDLSSEDKYNILLFSLQLPDICARYVFPQTCKNTGKSGRNPNVLYNRKGRPFDKNLYKCWMRHYFYEFKYLIKNNIKYDDFIDNIYDLRCDMTHQGIISIGNRVVFIPKDCGTLVTSDTLYLSVEDFCEKLLVSAKRSIETMDIDISSYDDLVMSEKDYRIRSNYIHSKYVTFWGKYTAVDRQLLLIYDCLFTNDMHDGNGDTLKDLVEDFFDKTPNEKYVINDFGWKYTNLSVDDRYIFESNLHSICCKFGKSDYERMLQLNNEIMSI